MKYTQIPTTIILTLTIHDSTNAAISTPSEPNVPMEEKRNIASVASDFYGSAKDRYGIHTSNISNKHQMACIIDETFRYCIFTSRLYFANLQMTF